MSHRSSLADAGAVSPIEASPTQATPARANVVAALALTAALLLLPALVHLDGRAHADWQQFLGRFHPLVVHLPIGLLVLVPLLEIVGAWRPGLRESVPLILGLALLGTLGALTLGWLLAYGSGTSSHTVTLHMWGGSVLAICLLACMLARPYWVSSDGFSQTRRRVYPVLLAGTLLALAFTAHQGGSITHGSGYLTQYMPASLKRFAPGGAVHAGNANSFYATQVDPILDSKCVSCHGESKTSGHLRLDSYEALVRGGKHGPAIVAGNPDKSLLLTRVTLPASHKLFMPAEGKPPLTPEETALIRTWIQQGASPSDTTLAGVSIRVPEADAPILPVGDYSTLEPAIQQMQRGQGAKLLPVSGKPSDGLVLYTVDTAATFGDTQLQELQKFAPYIVEVELGRTAVTDACFDTLAKFSHLRAIHLEGTTVSGEGLAKLTSLSQLAYLNLSGTRVTQSAAAPLAAMKNLRHLYLYDTPAQPSTGSTATRPAETPATNVKSD